MDLRCADKHCCCGRHNREGMHRFQTVGQLKRAFKRLRNRASIRGDLSSAMFSVALRADDTLAVLMTDLLIINSILVLSVGGWGSFNESCLRWLVNRTDRSSIKPSTGSAIEANVAATIDL
ncbi:hypothetical protein CDAR_516981 [Caerostris darwini]|uniref:Uncharacterized protein n=1 Tax=Caerostris darwini TaxID=1538125 RepID=A0AAV4UDZ3_9ARAC|nr:hypothetical protein CDAR_516981 [Caerostris darwini]